MERDVSETTPGGGETGEWLFIVDQGNRNSQDQEREVAYYKMDRSEKEKSIENRAWKERLEHDGFTCIQSVTFPRAQPQYWGVKNFDKLVQKMRGTPIKCREPFASHIMERFRIVLNVGEGSLVAGGKKLESAGGGAEY